MVKWRVIVLILVCSLGVYLFAADDGKGKLRAYLKYFGRTLTLALILYWLFFILAPPLFK